MTRQLLLGWNEFQGDTVIAPSFVGGWRAVLKNMSLMPTAASAMIFRASIEQFVIGLGFQMSLNGGIKARPTGMALVLRLRSK